MSQANKAPNTSMGEPTPQASATAMKGWLQANNVDTISSVDEIYHYNRKQQQDMLAAKPWDKECV